MKRLLIPALAALMTLSASGVFAASATDTIKSIDTVTYTVTLNDGQVFTFPSDYDLSALKAGDEVEITFNATDGMHHDTDYNTKIHATAAKSLM